MLTVALMATACASGGDGTSATGATPTQWPEPSPTAQPTPLTVTPEELASADIVLMTGEAPQGFDNDGFGFQD